MPASAPKLVTMSSLPANDNPAERLETHFRRVLAVTVPLEANPALSVEAIGFARHQGDWLGVIVTPWRIDLLLINGGGSLWGDIPAGQRRYLQLDGETLPFLCEDDPEIGPYQSSPLVDDLACIPDMATARAMAWHSLGVHLQHSAPPAAAPQDVKEAAPGVSRRGFFRRLAGKR